MRRGTPVTKLQETVAGVDGCRAGWIVVQAKPLPAGPSPKLGRASHVLTLVDIRVLPSFADVLAHTDTCVAVALDMLIGFSANGPRAADFEARRKIGPRRSSVFPPPARSVLETDGDYATLNALSKTLGAGVSRQTYNILPRMREVDALMTPALQGRVVESHPEVCFCAVKGTPLDHAKRHPEGRRERRSLLDTLYASSLEDGAPPRGAALDDLHDAAILAHTALRVARREASRLPDTPEVDERGLRMEIVY
jgi:predicted RNase H-like nuclease